MESLEFITGVFLTLLAVLGYTLLFLIIFVFVGLLFVWAVVRILTWLGSKL